MIIRDFISVIIQGEDYKFAQNQEIFNVLISDKENILNYIIISDTRYIYFHFMIIRDFISVIIQGED